jgi:hypothetical protein
MASRVRIPANGKLAAGSCEQDYAEGASGSKGRRKMGNREIRGEMNEDHEAVADHN